MDITMIIDIPNSLATVPWFVWLAIGLYYLVIKPLGVWGWRWELKERIMAFAKAWRLEQEEIWDRRIECLAKQIAWELKLSDQERQQWERWRAGLK
jgi:hypothetical protein